MDIHKQSSSSQKWAAFRLTVIGHLLAAPPKRGHLKTELFKLSERVWEHPIQKTPCRFACKTLEEWYYKAKSEVLNPMDGLLWKTRSDRGRFRCIPEKIKPLIFALHKSHSSWNHRLHYDNLKILVRDDPNLGLLPSYQTIVRFRNANDLRKAIAEDSKFRKYKGVIKKKLYETRLFEADHVNSLWHLDFHHSSKKVLHPSGEWVKPKLMAILDDHSRLICHLQWYFDETSKSLIHALSQAFLKRGLPRSLMSDNGSAMTSAETCQGLSRLGIIHETTLPYAPYQNGKQEVFFAKVESRLIAMLENVENLDLTLLNMATQAWVEEEYHRKIHSQTACTPLKRFMNSQSVSRPSPDLEVLKQAFCVEESRVIRKGDATVSIEGKRMEIPVRFAHLKRVTLRYATFDLSKVWIVDKNTSKLVARVYPVDLSKNSDKRRRKIPQKKVAFEEYESSAFGNEIAPLMQELIKEYVKTGLPPAYLPCEGKLPNANKLGNKGDQNEES